ncbi:MAG: hypothetical protein FJ314_05050 [SAR202 cluster bacterium]|nr:hypothetical protein [SAR202 cluster bacterium]
MDLTFERGDKARPRGHAIVYVRDSANRDAVSATYVVILPVSVDIAKYVPPFLAQQVPTLGERGLTAFAFPPAPEPVASYELLVGIADARDDDLIFAGTRALSDAAFLLALVGEVAAEYSTRYESWAGAVRGKPESEGAEALTDAAGVDGILYGLMSEADRLNELTKLVGRMRYASEGGDSSTVDEAEARIKALAQHVPTNRKIDRLLVAALSKSPEGSRLAQLYLERAYCLLREDYLRVKTLDGEIVKLEAAP